MKERDILLEIFSGNAYMDDVLTGAFLLDEARELRNQLIDLCTAGGFPLRKWTANDAALLEDIPADHRLQKELRSWQSNEVHSTLMLQ